MKTEVEHFASFVSHPYADVADRYDCSYTDVLLYAELCRSDDLTQPMVDATKRLPEDAKHEIMFMAQNPNGPGEGRCAELVVNARRRALIWQMRRLPRLNKDQHCKLCDERGLVWVGGQGGDYEVCECRKVNMK